MRAQDHLDMNPTYQIPQRNTPERCLGWWFKICMGKGKHDIAISLTITEFFRNLSQYFELYLSYSLINDEDCEKVSYGTMSVYSFLLCRIEITSLQISTPTAVILGLFAPIYEQKIIFDNDHQIRNAYVVDENWKLYWVRICFNKIRPRRMMEVNFQLCNAIISIV